MSPVASACCQSERINDKLHEVVQEVLIAVLVTGLREIVLGHHVLVSVVPLPREFLALLGNTGFLFALCQDQRSWT
jgi:hypothetical protein